MFPPQQMGSIQAHQSGNLHPMDPAAPHEVTRLLVEWKSGDDAGLNALLPLVESELRRLAGS